MHFLILQGATLPAQKTLHFLNANDFFLNSFWQNNSVDPFTTTNTYLSGNVTSYRLRRRYIERSDFLYPIAASVTVYLYESFINEIMLQKGTKLFVRN